jgi:hypothetical protein
MIYIEGIFRMNEFRKCCENYCESIVICVRQHELGVILHHSNVTLLGSMSQWAITRLVSVNGL